MSENTGYKQDKKQKGADIPRLTPEEDIIIEGTDEFAHLRTAGVSSTAITIVCSMVGAGMLSLPAAFARMGWVFGTVMIGLVGVFGMYSGCLLVKCMNTLDQDGKKRSAPTLNWVRVCFGKTGRIIAHIGTYGTCIGVGILFLILASDSFRDLTHAVSANAFTCISAVNCSSFCYFLRLSMGLHLFLPLETPCIFSDGAYLSLGKTSTFSRGIMEPLEKRN